ncbi:hypothetical protein GWI33_013450 [Rhynchophorus ferrugineus]|uniref:Uncharacterized protein n=1 Tax=Rhynchophorus ferrugineus TaxID=354439 RepID=A0A834I6G3_RHYFE|nr:hypothetical protein GWI33_013450 [Rhynchophorus ferrugineus]
MAEYGIQKEVILSITTDGVANMVAAVKQFLGDAKGIPCMAHLLNLVVDDAIKESPQILEITNRGKRYTTTANTGPGNKQIKVKENGNIRNTPNNLGKCLGWLRENRN